MTRSICKIESKGVGQLIKIAVEKANQQDQNIKPGIL